LALEFSGQSLATAAVYIGAGCAMGFGAIGSGVGEGITAREAVLGMSRQPKISGEIMRTMLLGQAVSESSGIFSLITAFLLIFGVTEVYPNEVFARGMIGCGLAVGISALGSGIGTGLTSAEASRSVARNPGSSNKVTMSMLLGQALATSPAVFGFVAGLLLFLLKGRYEVGSLANAAALLGAGLCMGVGATGPGFGIGLVGRGACIAVGRNPRATPAINKTMLLGSAVAESTSIYSFVIFILLTFVKFRVET
jgi:F0F1-type ATP synthase membrane subunit c/vacuolar-type H+-ATPase subunit K